MRRAGAGHIHVAGTTGIVAGAALLHSHRLAPDPYVLWWSERMLWWSLFTAVLLASGYGLGLPELARSRREVVARASAAYGSSLLVVSLAQVVLASPLLPRSSLFLLALVMPVWSVLSWNIGVDVDARNRQRDRVLLVVARPEEAAALTSDLLNRPEVPAVLVAALPIADARLGPRGEAPLLEAAAAALPTVVVLDTAAQSDVGIVDQVAELHRAGVRVRTLALFYEVWLGKLPVSELAQASLLFDIGERHRVGYVRAKRVIDLAFAVLGFVALGLVLPLVVMGNRIGNPGPLFFRQARVGRDGHPFSIIKFRSMAVSATDSSWTTPDDPRITRFGGALRRTHLDELPQVVNVLRGELSLVGPRPEQVRYVEELRRKIPFYDVRHLTRPGLTGWAQVKQGYAASEADALEKLQYDIFYQRRQGLSLDLRIAWRTVRGVLIGTGR